MTIWVDAHLSPRIARWLSDRFDVRATPIREFGLRDAPDTRIFEAAREAGAVEMTKDLDFVEMVERLGPPPQILWLTCGNTSEQKLREILEREFRAAREMFAAGEPRESRWWSYIDQSHRQRHLAADAQWGRTEQNGLAARILGDVSVTVSPARRFCDAGRDCTVSPSLVKDVG